MTFCSETVNRNGGNSRWSNIQPCGREAVEDGLCKLHLKVRDRRVARSRAFNEKMDRGEALRAEALVLSEHLGIDVTADYNTYLNGGSYTGNFIVPGDWLRSL